MDAVRAAEASDGDMGHLCVAHALQTKLAHRCCRCSAGLRGRASCVSRTSDTVRLRQSSTIDLDLTMAEVGMKDAGGGQAVRITIGVRAPGCSV